MIQHDYLLGVNAQELERLRFQHEVWGPLTQAFFLRLGVRPGWRCLDVGAGPGFVTADLRRHVGVEGQLTALEPSTFYAAALRRTCDREGWSNVHVVEASVETADLPESAFDLVFARWVASFVTDPPAFVHALARTLRVGGILAIQDYYYEGLSLYPRDGGFERALDAVQRYYQSAGGDPYIAGRMPALMRAAGLTLAGFTPHCLAGDMKSPLAEWSRRFFAAHVPLMVERGVLAPEDGAALLADWERHREDRDALFFSPIVVDIAARRDGTSPR